MLRNKGRTCRARKRRKLIVTSTHSGVNQSHKLEHIQLKKWLKHRGFEDNTLKTAHFPGTGRGLLATKSLQAGERIIALPERCLLTTGVVLESDLGEYIKNWKPPVSPLLALSTYLIAEKYAGDQSQWKPYLDVLPSSYTCPVCWDHSTVTLLPEPLRGKAQEQRTCLQELYTSSLPFFSSLQPLFPESVERILNYEALLWAWCTVNTRTVYMKHPHREWFSKEVDLYALAPYLDLLNHSPTVQVNAAFNQRSRCYEITAGSSCRKFEQVFICYGPHDNQRLLLEYGFVVSQNPHSVVYVPTAVLLQNVSKTDKQLNKKLSLLKEHAFLENLTFGIDGPSWKLLVALKLLCLEAEEFMCWKKVLIGERISDGNEKKAVALAIRICLHLIEDTCDAIEKISSLKGEKVDLKDQLTLVEQLRLEDLSILQASREILQNLG
ncbi:SET domain-containing protein 4 isoform X2 [Ambystoma mexicanum]|uniref:SET domain-containing protein 4 isoform X2 n=1 Tax=Ambystoma mexicanum TaxID=8296 RepID=UPI0037E720CE